MIDYNAFHNYLVALVALYRRTRTTKGMSELARRHHCTAITKDQFYQMKLDKLAPEQVTPQLSRVIRDTIGRSDARAVLRESIGALNEGILAGGRISQGSDRTVQITITQPAQEAVPQHANQKQSAALPPFKPGWIVFRKGGMMHLVSRLLDDDRFTWNYTLVRGEDGREYITEDREATASRLDSGDIRRARGSEVARFLGALTRSGYEWSADNANGLFFVAGKKHATGKAVEVFANDIPFGDHTGTGIHPLTAVSSSPYYRYALGPMLPIDNGERYMIQCRGTLTLDAVTKQLKSAFPDFGHVREMFECLMPTLCCSEEIGEYRVALVKDDNNGTCYWLARDRDVLRLLSWISFINN